MYICPPNLCPSGLPVWYRQYKSNIFTLKATSFGWQSMIFKVQFNIIKHKNVKEIHFCIIILAGKFVLSMNTYIFTATVSAILSNTLTEVLQYSYVSTGQISRKYRNNIPKTDTRVLFPCHQTWGVYKESKEIILSLEQCKLLRVFDAVSLQCLWLVIKETICSQGRNKVHDKVAYRSMA